MNVRAAINTVLFAGLLFLSACATKNQPVKPQPKPSPINVQSDVAVQAQGRRRVDPLQVIRPLIPSSPQSNRWVVLKFPNIFSTYTVYQRDSLSSGLWLVATNASTNTASIAIDKSVQARFFKTIAPTGNMGNVTLAWDASSDPVVAGYKLYYGGTTSVYTNKVDAGSVTNFVIHGLVSGKTYYFAATTYSTAGLESALSSEVSYLVPVLPTPVSSSITIMPKLPVTAVFPATNVTATSATVNGQVVSTGGDQVVTMFFYGRMDVVVNTNGYWEQIAITGNGTNLVSATLTNLVPNTTYYYVFAAENATGLWWTTNDLSFTTKASLALLTPRARAAASAAKPMFKAIKVLSTPAAPAFAPAPPPLPPIPAARPPLFHRNRTNSVQQIMVPPQKLSVQ